jgi:hypothetical protein
MKHSLIPPFRASSARPRLALRAAALLALVAPLLLFATRAKAGSTAPGGVGMSVEPLFGGDLTTANGWTDLVVRVAAPAGTPIRGELHVTSGVSAPSALTLPVDVGAAGTTQVLVPARSVDGEVAVTLTDERGAVLATTRVPTRARTSPALLVWSAGTHLGGELRGDEIPALRNEGRDMKLRVGNVERDPRTGAAIAPDSAAAYGQVDTVLLRAEDLAALDGAPLAALTTWVLAGGTLAVAPGGATELVDAPLVAMLGGVARRAREDGPVASFHGGNLRDSALGAVGSYGLGEVYVLGFDPLSVDGARDPRNQARIRELVARSFERRGLRAFPSHAMEGREPDGVLRALDPNQKYGGALALAALVLTLYAVLAGPVVHLRARKRRRPLDPLVQVPLLSAGAFGLIVVIGLASKGFSGRARHVTLVESGAGLSRGTGVAYRGFFTSRTTHLAVPSSSPGGRVARVDRYDGASLDRYVATPRGVALADLTVRPWRTVVVKESGFTYDLEGGVAMRRRPDGRLVVRNATEHALRDVLIADGLEAAYLGRIERGATATLSDGRALGPHFRMARGSLDSERGRRLSAPVLGAAIGAEEGARVAATWQLAEEIAWQSDFWPESSPVLIAELDSPRAAAQDSGLRLESERVLLRVVGEGGAP